ncbi:MAG TPA: HAMP domain-containing sensor histidine kinase [Bdellovibrionales bacterium]|nr:HAMP domain-containing sensor histidine kinase [Bdellovibrionales bacterium]
MRIRQQGIRYRIALLYLGIFATGLSVFCALLFQYFQRTQIQAFDTTLYNFAVDISTNLEMDFVGRLFVVNANVNEAGKLFPFHLGGSFLEIRDTSGKVLLHSRSLKDKNLPLDIQTLQRVSREKAIFQTVSSSRIGIAAARDDLRLLTYWTHHKDWREPLILQVAVPLDLPKRERRDLLLFFLLAIPTFLVVGGLAGVWMSKHALIPVRQITLKARGITGIEKLKERIPVPEADDEIHELAETFNGLLDRLDRAFASQDRFISNASHQLKTPLTILKGELDQLRRSQAAGGLSEGLESATAEINRLIQLVQDLLLLARLEGGRDTIALSPVRLDDVMMKSVARLQKLAQKKGVTIKTHMSAEACDELDTEVAGDEDLLDSMLENFIDNAVKYAPENSTVSVEMNTCLEKVELYVKDSGPGVPSDLRQKVFERFQRVEPSNIIPGSGLGLWIAAEIARIHGVEISLDARRDGPGTTVRLTFPRAETGLTRAAGPTNLLPS